MVARAITAVKNQFPEREEGQGMVEYGLIIALVAVVAIAGLIVLGPKIAALFTSLGSSV
jgi:pilus assembly protein Flp/PilA